MDPLDPLQLDSDGRSAVHRAVLQDTIQALHAMLAPSHATTDNRPTLQSILHADGAGWTPLHSAASANKHEAVLALLNARADPHAQNIAGCQPLHYAASKGHRACAALLLGARASPTARDTTGATPLHRAAARGHVDVLAMLVEACSSSELETCERSSGCTPILLAAAEGHEAAVVLLAEAGCCIDVCDASGASLSSLLPERVWSQIAG